MKTDFYSFLPPRALQPPGKTLGTQHITSEWKGFFVTSFELGLEILCHS